MKTGREIIMEYCENILNKNDSIAHIQTCDEILDELKKIITYAIFMTIALQLMD